MNWKPPGSAGMLLGALLLVLAGMPVRAASADVVYVTDELRLGLYRSEDTSGRPFKTIPSGTRLTILERSLMSALVRTEDGDEGWVKTAYVVTEEPARRRVERLERELEQLAQSLERQKQEQAALSTELAEAREALAAAEQGITDLPALREENRALKAELAATGARVSLTWLLVSAIACTVLGFALGYASLDRRLRRRFGGVRIH